MLHIHRAERADGLVEALGDLVRQPLADPFATEVVAVPTRGIERWLSQRLSGHLGARAGHGDGVCANVDFPFPVHMVGDAVATAAGIDGEVDPWLPERAVWPLLQVVDECLSEPWLAALAAHLRPAGTNQSAPRRFESIRHIAELYDRYAVHRPQMLCDWAAGHDADGSGGQLSEVAAWQAQLWRRLRERVAVPSPAERLTGACEALRAGTVAVDLPERVSLFGLTRLPASHLQVLGALAVHRDVHLFVLHPSPALWTKVAGAIDERTPIVRRADDPTAPLAENPLLASWGQDSREMQVVLAAAADGAEIHNLPVPGAPVTLLQRVQADVRADQAPPGAPLPGAPDRRPRLDRDDRSLQVHSCHGLARQVEVLRDAILHLLADDPTLEARDIIVMCPDIETFAPLIHATFGAGTGSGADEGPGDTANEPAPGPDLRVRLADRSLRQTNPVLSVVAELLDLASARVTATQVLDFANREPVRRRFELDDDDLARLEDWVAATGVRWGLDAEHRAPFALSWLDANTWRAGLDRILLGVALAEDDQPLVGGVLPLDDVGSGDIALAGRLAELVDRLQAALDDLGRPMSVQKWVAAIAGAADALTATPDRDAWQRLQLERLLGDVVAEATTSDTCSDQPLSLVEIRALLADRLRGRPTRANFRTGHLTICTLVPMRSIPHRVVCLLGLDDGVFPRKSARDGDDIILDDPHVGDRDGRAEDRQLLLDALLAATDQLVITYCGRDERTNAERPPAVPVGELLEVVDRTVRTGETRSGGEPIATRRRVLVNHPLQPFDRRNFTSGALSGDTPWSFDEVSLDGARALSHSRVAVTPFLDQPLPSAASSLVEVDDLVRFVQHPVKAFLRQRLGMGVSDRYEELDSAVPIELDYLEQWDVGQRLVEARLGGADAGRCIEAEVARGILPPGALAGGILEKVSRMVDEVVSAAVKFGAAGASASAEVNLSLGDGRSLVGTVPGVAGNVVRSVSYSRLGPKHRLAAWVRFLALTAAHPERPFEAVTVGRRRASGAPKYRVTVSRLTPFSSDPDKCRELALAHLAVLVDLYDRGMREPLPVYCSSSAAWAEAIASGKHADVVAAKAWESDWERDKEDKELEHQLVLGGRRSFADVVAAAPSPEESGEGWPTAEPTRFGRYAMRLWGGLLSCEELVDR
ncbi:MAG TPA: exodeoxyribonuclease V subunit gamma [Acidimicrobiales bacterium]|nr:exodeoxyribonuclease V subunit gamma [Acidimicrobiales bacterium]